MFCYFIGLKERNTDLLSLVGYCLSSDRPGPAGWLPCDRLRSPPTRPELPAPPAQHLPPRHPVPVAAHLAFVVRPMTYDQ